MAITNTTTSEIQPRERTLPFEFRFDIFPLWDFGSQVEIWYKSEVNIIAAEFFMHGPQTIPTTMSVTGDLVSQGTHGAGGMAAAASMTMLSGANNYFAMYNRDAVDTVIPKTDSWTLLTTLQNFEKPIGLEYTDEHDPNPGMGYNIFPFAHISNLRIIDHKFNTWLDQRGDRAVVRVSPHATGTQSWDARCSYSPAGETTGDTVVNILDLINGINYLQATTSLSDSDSETLSCNLPTGYSSYEAIWEAGYWDIERACSCYRIDRNADGSVDETDIVQLAYDVTRSTIVVSGMEQ